MLLIIALALAPRCAHGADGRHGPPVIFEGDTEDAGAASSGRRTAAAHCGYPKPYPGNANNNRVRGATAAVVHKMPKAGGNTFLTSLVALTCDAPEPARIEWSEWWSCSDGPRFLLLREPTAHVISMRDSMSKPRIPTVHRFSDGPLRDERASGTSRFDAGTTTASAARAWPGTATPA